MALSLDSTDLATFLGVVDINAARADMLIELAVALCATHVSPVPDGAAGIVLAAAARAYANPTFVKQEMNGPYQAMRERGGVYLLPDEVEQLQQLTGGNGGAVSVPMGGWL